MKTNSDPLDKELDELILTLMGCSGDEEDKRIYREDYTYIETKTKIQKLLIQARKDEVNGFQDAMFRDLDLPRYTRKRIRELSDE